MSRKIFLIVKNDTAVPQSNAVINYLNIRRSLYEIPDTWKNRIKRQSEIGLGGEWLERHNAAEVKEIMLRTASNVAALNPAVHLVFQRSNEWKLQQNYFSKGL